MSILIKGMEMPKNCEDCPCIDYKNWRCQVDDLWDKEHCPDSGRPDWCPLLPLPKKHGRLIDADALKTDLTAFYANEVTARQLIDRQPTVIPADEGE